MSNKITFKLTGPKDDSGFVLFSEFVSFCETVEKCLRRSESIVAPEDPSSQIEYRVADLKCASATVVLEARKRASVIDRSKEVLSFFRNTVKNIQSGRIDPRMGIDDLAVFREIAAPVLKSNGATRVAIGQFRISADYAKNIDKLLQGGLATEGYLTGKLERLNLHNKAEFVLYPVAGAASVTCVFPDSLLETVREAILRTVTISGTLFYREGQFHPNRVHVAAIEIHPRDADLPTLHDVANLGKWGTDGLSSVEFVRMLRDE